MKKAVVKDRWLEGKESNGFRLTPQAINQIKDWVRQKQPVLWGKLASLDSLQRSVATSDEIAGYVSMDETERIILEFTNEIHEVVAERYYPAFDIEAVPTGSEPDGIRVIDRIELFHPMLLVHKVLDEETGSIEPILDDSTV